MNEILKHLFFIRHAESVENFGSSQYMRDSLLTNEGNKQAEELAKNFPVDIDLIIHSPLKRTEATAEYLINRFPSATVECWDIGEFGYTNFDSTDNSFISTEIRKKYKYKYWENADKDYKITSKSESFAEFLYRISEFYKKANNLPNSKIAFISHKYFIKGLLWFYFMKDESELFNVKQFKKFNDLFPLANSNYISCLIYNNALFWGK